MNTSSVVNEFLTAQSQDGLSARHCESLGLRLNLFARHFARPIAAIEGPDIDKWLREQQAAKGWCGRSRNHYRAAISNLMGFAKRRRYLPPTWVEMECVPKAVEVDGEVQVFAPDTLRRLLLAVPDALLPFVAVGAFTGARPSEVQRAAWEDLHWDSGEFFVGLGKVRTAGHRVAPFLPVCQYWLMRVRSTGALVTLKDPYRQVARVAKRAGIAWVQDGLRHSFVSYRLAITKNIHQVSEETGTDADTLRKRYRRPVKQADAEAWFNITP